MKQKINPITIIVGVGVVLLFAIFVGIFILLNQNSDKGLTCVDLPASYGNSIMVKDGDLMQQNFYFIKDGNKVEGIMDFMTEHKGALQVYSIEGDTFDTIKNLYGKDLQVCWTKNMKTDTEVILG